MKHYRLKIPVESTAPALIFEVKLDLRDVRSGYRSSDYGYFQAEWIDEGEVSWTPDMVRRLPRKALEEIAPPRQVLWPLEGDQMMVQHLLRHFSPQIWKNYALGVYSLGSESRADFLERCHELLVEERRKELRKVHEIFLHRILEVEHRLLRDIEEREWSDETVKSRRMSQAKNLFSEVREDLSRHFLIEDLRPLDPSDLKWQGEIDPEIQERLNDLRDELVSRHNQIQQAYLETAGRIEPYQVPVSHSQVEILSRGILWNSRRSSLRPSIP